MKKILFIHILLIFCGICFGATKANGFPFENNEYIYEIYYSDFPNPGYSFSLRNKVISIDIPETDTLKQENGIYIKNKVAMEYKLQQEQDFIYLITESKKYLVLYYEDLLCILIDCDDYTTFCGISKFSPYVKLSSNNRIRDTWIGIEDVTSARFVESSSFLTEIINGNEKKYDGINKYMWQIHTPWCEGREGYGVNEWFQKTFFHEGDKIVILNGYVDPNHSDYYYKNGRIKDISVTTEKGTSDVVLKDIPQIQVIDLDKYTSGEIRLTIKSVYEGSKYKDTCLSFFCLLTRIN